MDYKSVEVDLLEGEEKKAAINEIKKHNPRLSFPTIVIGEKAFIGFKKKEIMKYIADQRPATYP